jgi:hypothetical protein
MSKKESQYGQYGSILVLPTNRAWGGHYDWKKNSSGSFYLKAWTMLVSSIWSHVAFFFIWTRDEAFIETNTHKLKQPIHVNNSAIYKCAM